jgi:hypothetical protein
MEQDNESLNAILSSNRAAFVNTSPSSIKDSEFHLIKEENQALREQLENDSRFQELQDSYNQILNLLLSKGDISEFVDSSLKTT